MQAMDLRRAAVACFAVFACALPPASALGAANLIPGGDFDAPADVAGWTASTPAPAVAIDFDSADGGNQPGSGSLALSRGAGNGNAVITASRCIATPGGIGIAVRLSGKVQGVSGRLALAAFADSDCSGPSVQSWTSPQQSVPGAWQTQNVVGSSLQADAVGSLLAVLQTQDSQVGDRVRFDDLSLTVQAAATAAADVPAISPLGLGAMALAVLAVAAATRRRIGSA
jgi:hypothetical protein